MSHKLLILSVFAGLFGCTDADDGTTPAEAVAVEFSSTNLAHTAPLTTVAGLVRVFGHEDVSLSGLTICEETTATCTTTDGRGGFELYAPSDTDLAFVVKGPDIFPSLVPVRAVPDVALELFVLPREAGEAFVELADGELADDTGMAFVVIEDVHGERLPKMWLTVRDFAAYGPIFAESGIVPTLEQKLSGEHGFGAYLEMPEGSQEIGVGGQGLSCSSPYWDQTDDELFRVPVRAATVTWLHVTCE